MQIMIYGIRSIIFEGEDQQGSREPRFRRAQRESSLDACLRVFAACAHPHKSDLTSAESRAELRHRH
jgi:hypothetical protein